MRFATVFPRGKEWARKYWVTLSTPSKVFSLGFLTISGFVAGIVFWGGFHAALEITNTEKFCVGCHEMRNNVFVELQPTIHYTNRSGVRATCPDCHVPHNWSDKIARKLQASTEVWGTLFGTSAHAKSFSKSALNSLSTNGRGSRPTTRWNAVIATTSIRWISRAKAIALRRRIRPNWRVGRKLASTATKGLRIACPTWHLLTTDDKSLCIVRYSPVRRVRKD